MLADLENNSYSYEMKFHNLKKIQQISL